MSGTTVKGDEGHRTALPVCTLANDTTSLGVVESAEPSMDEWQGQVGITSYLLAHTPRTSGSI